MELEGFKRCRDDLVSKDVQVASVTTDRHRSIAKFMREEWVRPEHFFDTWHISKGAHKTCYKHYSVSSIYIIMLYVLWPLCYNVCALWLIGIKKKMAQKSKVAAFRDLANWIKSICNHLYWCVYSTTDQDEREARWVLLLDHLVDRHENCPHPPIVERKKWITKG